MKSWNSFIFLLNKSLLSTLNAPDPVLSLQEVQWGDKLEIFVIHKELEGKLQLVSR